MTLKKTSDHEQRRNNSHADSEEKQSIGCIDLQLRGHSM